MQNTIIQIVTSGHECSHLEQIIFGIHEIAKKTNSIIKFNYDDNMPPAICKVIYPTNIMGGVCVIYDVYDGYNMKNKSNSGAIQIMSSLLNDVDFYFKRSFNSDVHKSLKYKNKIHPLGFNYSIFHKRYIPNFRYYRLRVSTIRGFLSIAFSGYCRIKSRIGLIKCRFIHKKPFSLSEISTPLPNSILFMVRLWDHQDIKDNFETPIHVINNMRIEAVRACRKKYGEQFIGGIQDSALARKLCPDLILDKTYTRREQYLQTMYNATICIATTGLHNSIGWKMAEYIASSKCIVSEKLMYDVPGDFKEGVNYLEFNNVNMLIEKIDSLLGDKQKQINMMQVNYEYYKKYLEPEQLIMNTINKLQ